MTLKTKKGIEHHAGQFCLGLCLTDGLLFTKLFQPGDMTEEPTPKQKLMILDEAPKIILRTSRNVGKSVSIRGRIMRDIATHVQPPYSDKWDEILVVAPSQAHLFPLVEKLFSDIYANPALRAMINKASRGDMPIIETRDQLRIFFRIEGLGDVIGRTQVSMHPKKIYLDEGAYGSHSAHRYRLDGAQPDAKWLYAGVPNDVRSTPFYELSATNKGKYWSQHNLRLLDDNPLFSRHSKRKRARYRAEKAQEHGGEHSPTFITQVLGEWGDEASSSFPDSSISWDSSYPYYPSLQTTMSIEEAVKTRNMAGILRVPVIRGEIAAIGWDYGHSPDPTTFMIAARGGDRVWRTFARIQLFAVPLPRQVEVLKFIWVSILEHRCAMLSTDNEQAYHSLLSDDNTHLFSDKVKLAKVKGQVAMDLETGQFLPDDYMQQNEPEWNRKKKDGKIVYYSRKFYLTETLKRFMGNHIMSRDETRLVLGYDVDLESELKATVERKTQAGNIIYEVPKKNKSYADQIVDATRYLVDAIAEIEKTGYQKPPDRTDMLETMGWVGRANGQRWDAPFIART